MSNIPLTHTSNIYESELLRAVTGTAVRPGGLTLTGRAMAFCQFPHRSRLLDVGCGFGATVSFLRSQFHMDAWGLDISFRLLSEGKTSDAELPLLCASGEHLPFGCGSLDGIICECVLSLLPEPGRALSEFYRVLRREGCLILSDIYLRGGETGEWVPAEEENLRKKPVYGCLKGALPTYSTETMLSQAGFAIHLWEDHTPFIKEFAARLVLAHGSLDAFFGGEKDAGCSGMGLPTMGALSPGYYLLVARKK